MALNESYVSQRPAIATGTIRRARMLMPLVSRSPWVLVIALILAGLGAGWAIATWPEHMPWGIFSFLVVVAGLFLEPRHLVVVFITLFTTLAVIGAALGDRKGATFGTEVVTLAIMLLMIWLAHARAQVGVVGVSGESMLVAISGLRVRRSEITLLDEPTNNLDRGTRARLAALVDDWPGTLVVVSHDLDLLEHMDETAELHAGRLTTFGGPYSAWRDRLEADQAAAAQAARTAEQTLRAEKRQRVEAETKLARRERTARTAQANRTGSRISMGLRASAAQRTR